LIWKNKQLPAAINYTSAPGLVVYTPSAVEWMISIGAIGLAFMMYYAADKFFNLDHTND
jgi:Ni/Fe-hydrogenase subunit HybB-like protein